MPRGNPIRAVCGKSLLIGLVVATAILAQFPVELAGGRLGYFITGFLGACLLIFLAKLVRR